MKTITAVIITCNEERNIGRCLESLQGVADEVVVVDSGSTDKTEEICRASDARFVSHPWEGYSGQKNFANGLASCDWILSLDADEALSPALRTSLLYWKSAGNVGDTVYSTNRLNNYCGHWVRHGSWYPDRHVRLWPRGLASWKGEVHEELHYAREPRQVLLKGDLLHYSYYSIDDHAARTIKYATLAGHKAYDSGHRCGMAAVVFKPAFSFLRDYLLRGGFLDGHTGYIVYRMSAYYTFLKYATLRQLSRQRPSS